VLAPRLGPEEAGTAARRALSAQNTDPFGMNELVQVVAALLVRLQPQGASQRAWLLTTAIGNNATPPAPLSALIPLLHAARPLPGRFTEQELVNFLKLPTCQRTAREVILRQLGHQCGRPFANQWEFVAWARLHRPDFDLTSPPVRPSPP
jgi:hypothetical protein